MSTSSAREIADALTETAGEPMRLLGGFDYTLQDPEAPAGQIHVHFVPVTPHGDGMCLGCG